MNNYASKIIHHPEALWQFMAPFRLLVAGSSACGKSTFILKLLQNQKYFFNVNFDTVLYCYPSQGMTENRSNYVKSLQSIFPHLETNENIPDIFDIMHLPGHKLIIFDDIYHKIIDQEIIRDLMTTHSHHGNISLMITSQNYFMQGKYAKSIMRNFSELVIFDSKMQREVVNFISRQIFPYQKNLSSNIHDWQRKYIDSSSHSY